MLSPTILLWPLPQTFHCRSSSVSLISFPRSFRLQTSPLKAATARTLRNIYPSSKGYPKAARAISEGGLSAFQNVAHHFSDMRFLQAPCLVADGWECQSASNFDPLDRRALAVALAPAELVGVAETGRARVGK